MVRLKAVILLAFALAGCGRVRPDPVMPATQAGYPSAEFEVGNRRWVGLGVVRVNEGDPLDSVGLKVQGYYQGTIRFASSCRANEQPIDSVRYTNSQPVEFHLSGAATESCVVSFAVSPEYPREQKTTVVIHSFIGHVYVRVLKPEHKLVTETAKYVESTQVNDELVFQVASAQAQVVFRSTECGVSFDRLLPAVNGEIRIPASDVLPAVPPRVCIVNGAVIEDSGVTRVTWMFAGYSTKFIPLPIPLLDQSSRTLKVSTSDSVSVLALDGKYVLDNEASFKFSPDQKHTLRAITTGGRLMVGEYEPMRGWKWIW